ncbi:DUF2130 domain-containing protein [Bradyrhizobium manausense]|uniref:DUF2130 domain-containing protein n=1 Tax=Bradyrhizobium manausense TaxID=989370 RepID=UPI001BA78F8F|nr:DUF2130 domain-containing protein [Bradyrhizobium manausense]MBR0831355.1 DUF2130 domain-containing protein [Bradyrhizobium manausense]
MNIHAHKHSGFDQVDCPKCGSVIPLSEAIAARVAEEALLELSARQEEQRQLIAKTEHELASRRAALEGEFSERLESALEHRAASTRDATSLEIADLKQAISEKNAQIERAHEIELRLRSERRAIEDRVKNVDLEIKRKVDLERREIETNLANRLEQTYQLRIADKDKALHDARKANEELSRKLLQGSQQSQGEVLELELEAELRTAFPGDQFDPVPIGMTGADIAHKVISRSGLVCGTIVWEAKRTKGWNDNWITKLKDDQLTMRAELAVLVTDKMPPDCRHFAQIDNVWVANPQCAVSLAVALRHQLAEVALARKSAIGRGEKLELLHTYLTGAEFRQRVEVIVETFTAMQIDLQEERRAFLRRCTRREKQLNRVIGSTAGLYGDLQGVLGASLGSIPSLELAPPESSPDGDYVAGPIPLDQR